MRRAGSRSLLRRARRLLAPVVVLGLLSGSGMAWAEDPAPADPRTASPAPGAGEASGTAGGIVERWRSAPPSERRRMRAAMRERWELATPRERRRMGRVMRGLERALPDFSPIERMVLIRAAMSLSEEERGTLRRRLRRIDDLEPDERRAFLAELRGMIAAEGSELERLERNRRRWEGLSEGERAEVREQMRRWQAMSLEERRALLEAMEAEREAGDGR